MTKNNDYRSFMLRFRCTQNDGSPTWIASLQDTQTSEQQWFSNLQGLFGYLQARFGSDLKLDDTCSATIQATENLRQTE